MNIFTNFMHIALQEAEIAMQKGEVPVGAVIIHNNQVIAKTHNLTGINPLWHAEILAIQKAQIILKKKFLNNCQIFITLEPCQMCLHALLAVQLTRIYFGATTCQKINNNIEIYDFIEEKKCSILLKKYFLNKRGR